MTGWWTIPLLTGLYVLVLSSMKPWDWVIGGALASGLWFASRHLLHTASDKTMPPLWYRVCYAPLLAGAVLWEILRDTWRVALLTIGWKPADRPGFIEVPVGKWSDQGITVGCMLHTLTPCTYLVETDLERKVMVFRVLDGADSDAARRRIERFYQRYQRHVFP